MIAALVLAGGRSRRLGEEKAMVSFNGEPLLTRAVNRLARQGYAVAINAAKGSGAAAWAALNDRPLLPDDPADPVGPLAGVRAGLLWARSEGADVLVTAPCDTPRLPDRLERSLVARLTPTAGAATARSPSGLQSLCTAWRVAPTIEALTAHFAAGHHPAVHDLLAQLGAVEAIFADDAAFANLNTWDDIARAEKR